MKITRWKGATEKGLLREPLKRQLIKRLEQSGLDFAHGWVHEEDGSIHVVKNADNIIADVVYEEEIPEIPALQEHERYVWLEFTNLIVDCPRFPRGASAQQEDCSCDYYELRDIGFYKEYHMCHGIRIIEQPTYILFIEHNGVLKLAGAHSLAGCPIYHFGTLPYSLAYAIKSMLNGISILPFDLHRTLYDYVGSLHPNATWIYAPTSDIIIDQENPFNLMYILTIWARVSSDTDGDGDKDISTYYYYNFGIPITLVRVGRTELGRGTSPEGSLWNLPLVTDFVFNQTHHYGFSDSSILWWLNPNFTSSYFGGYNFYYIPMEDSWYPDTPDYIYSSSVIKSDGMFPTFRVGDPYNWLIKPFVPFIYTLMPIIGNFILLDSPQIRTCPYTGTTGCTGREESNPSFELINGVVYRTRDFYSPTYHLFTNHAVKTFKNYALGLENLLQLHGTFDDGDKSVVYYTPISDFHSDFINVASDKGLFPSETESYFSIEYNRWWNNGDWEVGYTGHKRLYIYPNLMQLDFALGHRIYSVYDAADTQYNSIVENYAIEALGINRTQTSIFGFIKNEFDDSLIVYDELNKPFGLPFWKGGLCNSSYFGKTDMVANRCDPEHPTMYIQWSFTSSELNFKLIGDDLWMAESGFIFLFTCSTKNAPWHGESSDEYAIPFNNRIPVNVIEPMRLLDKGGTLYPEIHTKRLRKFNFCFNNGLFKIYCGLSENLDDYVFLDNGLAEECFPPPVIPARHSSIMSFLRGVHILGEKGYEYFSFWEDEQDFTKQYPPIKPMI